MVAGQPGMYTGQPGMWPLHGSGLTVMHREDCCRIKDNVYRVRRKCKIKIYENCPFKKYL